MFSGVYLGKDTEADEVILGVSAMECGWSEQNVVSAVAAQR